MIKRILLIGNMLIISNTFSMQQPPLPRMRRTVGAFNQTECPICLESLVNTPHTALPCNHHLHTACLVRLNAHYADAPCPLCRTPVHGPMTLRKRFCKKTKEVLCGFTMALACSVAWLSIFKDCPIDRDYDIQSY